MAITKQLDPGTTDPQVLELQRFLNSKGFTVAANGPGSPGNETSYFGPATQAALKKYQAANGIVSSGDAKSTGYGRVGPVTLGSISSGDNVGAGGNNSTTGTTGGASGGPQGGVTYSSTGNTQLDSILDGVKGLANSLIVNGYTIPSTLQITPDLVSKFLDYAHQNVDPYYKQQLSNEIENVNASLKNLSTNYDASKGDIFQNFGTNLANEQEAAGGAGTAFSGQRGINEGNLVAKANRDLGVLGANTEYNIGNTLRTGAANVGADKAGAFNLPSLSVGGVSNEGGQRGTTSASRTLDFGYNPSTYKVGNITSANTEAANTLKNTYLGNYGTLAGSQSNSGRSVTDLLGMMGLT